MTENSRTVAVIKGQMVKFSGIIVKGLPKPKRRLVKEPTHQFVTGALVLKSET